MILVAHPICRFTYEDACRAGDDWGFNCGPAAVAAICGLSLDELRPHLGDFELKRYTNPTLMWEILHNLAVGFEVDFCPYHPDRVAPGWPKFGLARVQWEGPWTEPGVPIAARYRKTHWVGVMQAFGAVGVWDVNCLNNGTGWVSAEDWSNSLVPWLLKAAVPKASGGWHLTHAVEVKR